VQITNKDTLVLDDGYASNAAGILHDKVFTGSTGTASAKLVSVVSPTSPLRVPGSGF
jgi:hypothetical protein